MTEIHGRCDPNFELVKAAFAGNFAAHDEIGASVAVSFEGEFVVDLWAGHLTRDKTTPWQEDTIINVWSSTKTMAAMCLLVLADRGEVGRCEELDRGLARRDRAVRHRSCGRDQGARKENQDPFLKRLDR